MTVYQAPGLTADWLNAWLAAVGVTVLLPTVTLSWTTDPSPTATLHGGGPLETEVATALASADIDSMAIARTSPSGRGQMKRTVDRETFRWRARLARRCHDGSLELSVTDLAQEQHGLAHSPFDPPAPRGVTLHDLLRACLDYLAVGVGEARGMVSQSLQGRGVRVSANGLGFDARRFAGSVQADANPYVDPVVEALAFFGLRVFPSRGDGRSPRPRGWLTGVGRQRFHWPVWAQPLDRWAIDALLDVFYAAGGASAAAVRRVGVTGAFATVYHRPSGQQDVNRAYAAERLW